MRSLPQLWPEGDLYDRSWDELLVLHAHTLLDDGFRICAECESINQGYFCRKCGHRFGGDQNVECTACGVYYPVATIFCELCGRKIGTDAAEQALKDGTTDIADETPDVVPISEEARNSLFDKLDHDFQYLQIGEKRHGG